MNINELDAHVTTDEGYFVSENHMRIARIIKDYDPYLELAFIPAASRSPEDLGREFAVIHRPPNQPDYVVFHCSAEEVDERLLARLFRGDTAKRDVIGWLDGVEAARQAIKLKKQDEEAEARQDFVKSVIGSHLNTYKHNGVKYQ